ncbi:hypothetical protein M0R45_025226 [Rubus argutus]|uniref:Protein kinase domain-containing protein n=1 Tax=Rubus argutus TaxID=59490 RepID=A0AAW1WTX6_RUBAR
MKMALLVRLHIISIVLLLAINSKAAAAADHELAPPQIAKPNCTAQCGGVSIPYPFGIGPKSSCYFDEWFQIDCHNSTTPILRRSQLEVLDVSIPSWYGSYTLRVKSPVTFFSCKGKEIRQAANLTGSPFVYSQERNKFVAVSCGFFALVSSDPEFIRSCMSICETNSDRDNYDCDNGINCCKISIPPYLTVINSSIHTQARKSPMADCDDYAFLVDQEWFENISVNDFRAVKKMDSVPVVLDWSLSFDNTTSLIKLFAGLSAKTIFERFSTEPSRNLNHTTTTCWFNNPNMTYNNRPTVECYCPHGFQGNPFLLQPCQDIDECLGSGIGVLLLLMGAWWAHEAVKKRKIIKRKKMFFKRNGGLLLEQKILYGVVNVEKIKLFNSNELEKSTDNFNVDRVVGQGGQGTVFKGMLADGNVVAIKRSKIDHDGKVSEFINEVIILSQLNHRNIVQLLGCCLETEVPLEVIPNGTLSQYIYEHNDEFPLTWKLRLQIATEIAGALSYLHVAATFPIYHRDIKSTNILLDGKYRAKIADFGTSRSVAIDQTHLTTNVHGTFGYLDPEYFQSSKFTEKSDVYSFGVVLVELLTGQKPISVVKRSTDEEQEYRSLAAYFMVSMQEGCLFDILDARVVDEGSKEDIMIVANLARRCLDLNGRNRPTMREVTAELEAIQLSNKTHQGAESFIPEYPIEHCDDVISSSTGSTWDSGSTSTVLEISISSM